MSRLSRRRSGGRSGRRGVGVVGVAGHCVLGVRRCRRLLLLLQRRRRGNHLSKVMVIKKENNKGKGLIFKDTLFHLIKL